MSDVHVGVVFDDVTELSGLVLLETWDCELSGVVFDHDVGL